MEINITWINLMATFWEKYYQTLVTEPLVRKETTLCMRWMTKLDGDFYTNYILKPWHKKHVGEVQMSSLTTVEGG